MVSVVELNSVEEVANVHHVVAQLYPDLELDRFVGQVGKQFQSGYRMIALQQQEEIYAVAGFRVKQQLGDKKYLYVEDFVTNERYRSQGCGKMLLSWLKAEALNNACKSLRLDLDCTNQQAHRFFVQQRLALNGYHLVLPLH